MNKLQLDKILTLVDLAKDENKKFAKQIASEIFLMELNNTKSKTQGFDIYDFTSKDARRMALNGVYHHNGCRIACDAHVLIAIKDTYDENLEGKILLKDAQSLDGFKYPDYESIKPKYDGTNNAEIDFDKVDGFIKEYKAHHKMLSAKDKKFHEEYVKIGEWYCDLLLMQTFIKGMKYLGTNKLLFDNKDPYRRCAYVESDKGWAVIMPIMNPNADLTDGETPKQVYSL